MIEQAKEVSTLIARLVAGPTGALLPAELRGLLGSVAELLIEMSGRIENLERKDDGQVEER